MIVTPSDLAPVPDPQPRAFICHASQDAGTASELCDQLLDSGCGIWLDKRILIPGQEFEHEIRRAISHTDAIIVILSKNSADKTGFLQRELRIALEAADERPPGSVFIVPVRLDDARVPAHLSKWHWVDARRSGWTNDVLDSLRQACRRSTHTLIAGSTDVDSHVIGLRATPSTLRRGDRLILDYKISLETSEAIPVALGASLIDNKGKEFCDRAGDRRLLLRTGTSVYRRRFKISSGTPKSEYRLVGAVWFNRIGADVMARVDYPGLISVNA